MNSQVCDSLILKLEEKQTSGLHTSEIKYSKVLFVKLNILHQ